MASSSDIQKVMRECECGKERAINLLKRSGNEVQKAINKHQATMALVNRHRPSPEDTEPVDYDPDESRREQLQYRNDRYSDNGFSDEDPTYGTPMTEEENATKSNLPPEDLQYRRSQMHRKSNHEEENHDHRLATLPHPPDDIPLGNLVAEMALWEEKQIQERVPGSSEFTMPQIRGEPILTRSDSTSEESWNGEEVNTEWDFVLPPLVGPATLQHWTGQGQDGFSLSDILGAMQNGATPQDVLDYFGYYEQGTIRANINGTELGFPAMFFVVATNNDKILRIWVEHGGDVSVVHAASKVPLLAFAIMNAETAQTDTTQIVATLLSLGALAQVIPSGFYIPFCHDLPDKGPELDDLGDENKQWCTEAAKDKLTRTMNITQRYYLERAIKTPKPSVRHRQVALRRNAESLLGIPYFLIGQATAASLLLQNLLSYIMIPSKKPLVLAFAGPSGHGKTELARRLGYLMSLELEVVDCTIFSHEMELFGPRKPYVGWEGGSPLNNFLAKHDGERCIVFLDEFEKTTKDIHQALLLPFDNGEYQDRRHLTKINCSKTIWILATNALDATIQDFCTANHADLFLNDDASKKMRLMKSLSKEIKQGFLSRFDAPLTGRISTFIPFLPFSPGEQAVIVHKYLLELGQQVRAPIDLSTGQNERLLGNVRLRIRRDASVCSILAKAEYHSDIGARSLITGVKTVEASLVAAYLEVGDEIIETDKMVDFMVDVNGGEVIANMVQPVENKDVGDKG